MQCPKCKSPMEEQTLSTLEGNVTVDRCVTCKGLWFDIGEAETLKRKWMSDHVDTGDPTIGREQNKIRDICCPRCGDPMEKLQANPYRVRGLRKARYVFGCRGIYRLQARNAHGYFS